MTAVTFVAERGGVPGFITVTRVTANDQRFPGYRIAVSRILGYGPGSRERVGGVIYVLDNRGAAGEDWPVAETCEEIDALIAAAGEA